MNCPTARLVGGLALACSALGCGLKLPALTEARGSAHRSSRAIYPRLGASFVGLTSQSQAALALPVSLVASATGPVIDRFDIQWAASCQTAGRGSGGLSTILSKRISPLGTFTDSRTVATAYANGDRGRMTTTLVGRFTSPVRVAGTFKVSGVITDSANTTTNTCDSGTITWSATD